MTVSVEEAKQKLEELLQKALAGETVEIQHGKVTARLVIEREPVPTGNRLGSQKGVLIYMSEDFNAPLDDFKDYME